MVQTTLLGVSMLSLKVLGPTAEGIMVASILPEDETYASPNETENKQLNAIINNLLCSSVCRELKHLILKSKEISEDAHFIWDLLFDIANTKWDELESDDEDEPVECALKPLQHPLIIKHQPQGRRRQEKRKWSLSGGGGQTAP
jgi:hypothetical protein